MCQGCSVRGEPGGLPVDAEKVDELRGVRYSPLIGFEFTIDAAEMRYLMAEGENSPAGFDHRRPAFLDLVGREPMEARE